MSATVLFVYIPVDKIEICNGPGPISFHRAITRLYAHRAASGADLYAELEFTLRTPASVRTFRRKLKIAEADATRPDFGELGYEVPFTALFNNQIVSGYYKPAERRGWFSLD